MSDIWKTWDEVKKICKDRKVVLWGRSEDWVPKTVPKFGFAKEQYIIDSNPAYKNAEFCGLPVFPPEKLEEEEKNDIYIVITASVYESVSEQLVDMGYEPGVNFCCTPEIRDWGLLQEIREYDKNVIVTCSDYSEKGKKRYSRLGGGIYVCNTRENELEKKIPGHFRQIVPVEENYFVVEYVEKRIYVLSKDLKKLDTLPLDPDNKHQEQPNGCGITYHPRLKQIFVANAGSDTINIYDQKNFKLIDTIHFSEKYNLSGNGQHHINDICIVGDNLYVSYFSISGNWKRGVLDGGISEFNLNKLEKGHQQVVDGLWMPHSVEFFDGNLCYLDSMRGEFYIGNQKIAGKFHGFIRGLSFDGRFYYVGQSEDMYMGRLFGVSENIMVNAGLYLFDVTTKVSRFYSFPFIMNIHDLMILP
jgi:hypothetical protein